MGQGHEPRPLRPHLAAAPGRSALSVGLTTMNRAQVRAAAIVTIVAFSAVAACSGGAKHVASPPPTISASPTPTPTQPLLATLNGLRPGGGPVVVIKVDNSPSARPLQK